MAFIGCPAVLLVRQAIRDLLANPLIGRELRLNLSGFRSYRVKGYRVLYRINDRDGFLEIYYAGRKRDVYENSQILLAESDMPAD